MQLKKNTNYAIRMIVEMAKKHKITCKEIAELLDVEEAYAAGILSKLSKASMIEAVQGVNGGYVLKADVKKLTLYDVAEVMESTMKINRCLEDDQYCSRHATEWCPVRKKYEKIQKMVEEGLTSVTFQYFLDYVERENPNDSHR